MDANSENLLREHALTTSLAAIAEKASQNEAIEATREYLRHLVPRGTLEDRITEVAARSIVRDPLPEIEIYERDHQSRIAASWNRWIRGQKDRFSLTLPSSEGHLDLIVLDSWELAVTQLHEGSDEARGSFLRASELANEYRVPFRDMILWSYAASFCR